MSEFTEYTLVDQDGNEHVVGNASDRARLISQGYKEKQTAESEPTAPVEASSDKPKPKPGSAVAALLRDDSK